MPHPGRFAVAVTCIDGRIQAAVADAVRRTHAVEYVDMVTVPGVDGALREDGPARKQVRSAVGVSVEAHDSAVVVVAGHTDCAGHPVDDQGHAADVGAAADWLRSEFPHLTVLGTVVHTASGTLRPV